MVSVVQAVSFSGLRTAQMCLIRSSAMSNAITVTVTPSLLSDQAGLTVDGAFDQDQVGQPVGEVDARAGDLLGAVDRFERRRETRPPPSATAVASGSSRPMRASMSLASQACLKSRTMPARVRVGVAERLRRLDAAPGRRRELATRHRRAADDLGDLGEGVAEHVVEDERDALGGCHRLEHDEEGHVDRLVERDPVGRVHGGAA